MYNAENLPIETTPNIYEASAGSSLDFGNGFPLAERSNNPVDVGAVEDPPPQYVHVSNASTAPVYSVVHNNRSGNVVQSDASAPAGDTAAKDESMMSVVSSVADNGITQPSVPPTRSSLYHDLTLIDNDLYD